MSDNPQDTLRVSAWNWLTAGRRKWVTYPAFFIFVAVAVMATFAENLKELRGALPFKDDRPLSTLSPGEKDVLDEWVMLVEAEQSREQALADARELTGALFVPELKPRLTPETEPADVLVVRDPVNAERWLLVVDMLPGEGDEETQRKVIGRIASASRKQGGPEHPIGRWVMNSVAYRYSRRDFERTYGRIDPNREAGPPGLSDKIAQKINSKT
jgi:hypothetical protein